MAEFKGKVTNSNELINAMTSIAEIIDEGLFRFTDEGFKLVAADRAMVAVCDFLFKKEAFELYELEGTVELGLNVADLLKRLKRFGNEVTFEFDDGKFTMYGEVENFGLKKFNQPVLEITQEEVPPIENLEFAGDLEFSVSKMREMVEDSAIVSDALVFDVTPNDVRLRARSDMSEYELKVERTDEMQMAFDREVKAMFAIDYLSKMLKSDISKTVKLSLSTDHPIRMLAENESARLIWICAPRVIEDEE